MADFNKIVRLSKENRILLQECMHRIRSKEDIQKYFGLCKAHELNALLLLSIECPVDLCFFLNTPIHQLEEIINNPVYHHYTINKKRGGKRHIFAPDKQLKMIQKRLNYYLQAYYLWIKPSEVHGFVINPHYLGAHCNIVANARVHTGKKHIVNIDLKDFFPSISAKQIFELFSSPYFNYDKQLATALTLLTTYQAQLPAGAPTSPVLSNFVSLHLDADLRAFCSQNELLFTRYADDLTFSSDHIILQRKISDIIQLISKNGFEINPQKLHALSSFRKQTVTGLTVNEKVNVDRRLLKKIRAMCHDLSTNGLEAATRHHFQLRGSVTPKKLALFQRRLEGYLNFVGQVRGKDDPLCAFKKNFGK